MKRKLLLSLSAALLSASLMAGGIMTNTNQSAAYVRLLARNASLGIDGVYYNPAGLTKLGNGFHLSLNNQSIFQTKDVTNDYQYLHDSPNAKYTGDVKAPLFPGIYAAYKVNKFAFSFGFNPVGGGGGATYAKGLPSFEMPISDLVPKLAPKSETDPNYKITDYKADINFEGTSVYFGYQAGVSYEINPAISVFAGLRYVTAKNTYKGAITDIMINPSTPNLPYLGPSYNGAFMRADLFGTEQATYYTGVATSYTTAAQKSADIIAYNASLGSLSFAQAKAAGVPITDEELAKLEFGLQAAGFDKATPIATAQVVYTSAASKATSGAVQMTGLAAQTGDAEVDVLQKGTGFTPILGANLTLAEKLTIAIKYEFLTKIELTNETKVDGTGSFPDGEVSRADMPALLSIGASYPLTDKLTASLGMNYYFDKSADYNVKDTLGNHVPNSSVIDKNNWELAFGLEYNLTDKFLLSGGYLRAQTGVTKDYQNDLTNELSSNTVGLGGQYKFSPAIALNLGALYTMYSDDSKTFNHKLGNMYIPVNETYSRATWLVSIGLDITIGK